MGEAITNIKEETGEVKESQTTQVVVEETPVVTKATKKKKKKKNKKWPLWIII